MEAVVVSVQPCGEADLIVRVISPTHGKTSIYARQARKSRKRFGSTIDIFDWGRFETKRGKGDLPQLQAFIPLGGFHRIRDSIEQISVASLLCEACNGLIPEDAPAEESVFETLHLGLRAMNETSDLKELLRAGHVTLSALLIQAGFLDAQLRTAPSARNFMRIIHQIELSLERRLASKHAVSLLVDQLRRDHLQGVEQRAQSSAVATSNPNALKA